MAALQNIRDRAALMAYVNQGQSVKYLFFWGHTPRQPDRLGKECLSQWYPASFELNGNIYLTAEHYMMAEKARLFDDKSLLANILAARNPAEAKQLGRSIREFDEHAWNQHRFDIVVAGNHAKFSQNAALGKFLRNTKERVLVEASPKDRIWGIGLAANDPNASNPNLWKGLNLLGFALMEARDHCFDDKG